MTENCDCPKDDVIISNETLSKEEMIETTQEELVLEATSERYYLGVDV